MLTLKQDSKLSQVVRLHNAITCMSSGPDVQVKLFKKLADSKIYRMEFYAKDDEFGIFIEGTVDGKINWPDYYITIGEHGKYVFERQEYASVHDILVKINNDLQRYENRNSFSGRGLWGD